MELLHARPRPPPPTPRRWASRRPPAPTPPHLSDSEREKLRARLRAGTLDDQEVEVDVAEGQTTFLRNFSGQGMEEMGVNLQDLFKNLPGMNRTKRRKVKVPEALRLLVQEEAQQLVDKDRVTPRGADPRGDHGIIFIDEIDKIASRGGGHGGGPDVSREGVQRDILPIVEGSTVTTKYGPVKTDHVLFIAAGAFHVSKPSDLIPELQGRFPIRVELEPLSRQDLVRILSEPKNSLLRQYTALLATEGVRLHFADDAIAEIARIAQTVNDRAENIGARRLHTVMERLLDEVSFAASDLRSARSHRGRRATSASASPRSSRTRTSPATSSEPLPLDRPFAPMTHALDVAREARCRQRLHRPQRGMGEARTGRTCSRTTASSRWCWSAGRACTSGT